MPSRRVCIVQAIFNYFKIIFLDNCHEYFIENTMMNHLANNLKSIKLVILTLMLFVNGSSAGQDQELINSCINEQLAAHKDMGKSLTEKNFRLYCTCVSKKITEALSDKQRSELSHLNQNQKPDWLTHSQKDAESACMHHDLKIKT